MRLTALILTGFGLATCTSYTDKTSPCFGQNGAPVVSRGAPSPLSVSTRSQGPADDCVFEPVNER